MRQTVIGRFALFLLRLLGAFVFLGFALWGALSLTFRLPVPLTMRYVAAAVFVVLALMAVLGLWRRRSLWPFAYAGVIVLLLGWWSTIVPRGDKDWAPDVALTLTGKVEGGAVHFTNIRNFDWRSNSDFTERWEDATFALDDLRSVDLINSYWAGPKIAHTLVSFGFTGDRYLVFSIEVRRRKGEEYSEIAGFFKEDELAIVGARERDIIRVRSNVRGEDVQLFHVRVEPATAQRIFLALVEEANDIAAQPRFYNTVTANCTTLLFKLAHGLDRALPLDWRILVSGYLPDYTYDQGLLDGDVPLAELRARGRINERAQAADRSEAFSTLIRDGVPGP